jgi:GNAT superfamily N-acetyltransferase
VLASSPDDFQAFAVLVRQYLDWVGQRYADDPWFVEVAVRQLSLEAERASLTYSPPHGKVLLYKEGDLVGGACAYRVLPDETCEMKRFFVTDAFRGRGVGRQLCAAIIELARADGFGLMRLDTAKRFTEAQAMYAAFGFQPCQPYLEYPVDVLPYIVFMERPLRQ